MYNFIGIDAVDIEEKLLGLREDTRWKKKTEKHFGC